MAHRRSRAAKTTDGYLWFEGRDDDVIVSAGYRIGPFEVESALVAHPAVAEAAAVAAPDEERGAVVRAVVVLRDGDRPLARAGARAAGARQARDRALQVPAHRRVRARAAEDRQRQDQAAELRRLRVPERISGPRLALTQAAPPARARSTSCSHPRSAGGRSDQATQRRNAARRRPQHRRDQVGEVIAAGQRARQRVPARASALWCGRSRSFPSVARPIAPNSCTDTLMMPEASPASRLRRVGHADRQQRQERGAGAEPEQQEREEQPWEVARVHARVDEQQQAGDDRDEPGAQRAAARRSARPPAPRRPIDMTRDRDRQRHEREARVDRVIAEHALEVQRARGRRPRTCP